MNEETRNELIGIVKRLKEIAQKQKASIYTSASQYECGTMSIHIIAEGNENDNTLEDVDGVGILTSYV